MTVSEIPEAVCVLPGGRTTIVSQPIDPVQFKEIRAKLPDTIPVWSVDAEAARRQ
jgi:hypothetical protein